MNKLECANLIKTLYGAYPNTKMDNPMGLIDSYMLILGGYEAETVYKAARMYMASGSKAKRYFPQPGELQKYIGLAPYMFNPDSMALPEESDGGSIEDDDKNGCDLCPYIDSCDKEHCKF